MTEEGSALQFVGPSPFEEFVGIEVEVSDQSRAAETEFFRVASEKVSLCMTQLGWAGFQPDLPGVGAIVPGTTVRPFADIESQRRNAESNGYGVYEDVFGGELESGVQRADPNERYVQSLDPGEQSAYFRDLYGIDGEAGCVQRSLGEAAVELGLDGRDEVLFDLEAELADLVAADPRNLEAQRKWQECAAAKGYGDYESRDDITLRLFDEVSERTEEENVPSELRRIEREMAVALAECDFELDQTIWSIRSDVERAFVADRRAEIEAAILSLES